MHYNHFLITLSLYLVLGAGAGFLSGLFGAGGGLIIVPGLIFLFQWERMNHTVSMHVAVGTSLATMIPVALRSLRSHMKYGVPFFPIYRQMMSGLIAGVLLGGISAHFMHSRILEILFGLFVLLMAGSLLFERTAKVEAHLPGRAGMLSAGAFVGVQSGLFGVAGSAFSVPFLTYRGVNMHIAVVVSVAIAMTVSIIGTVVFIVLGLNTPHLPQWSTGYVYWPAWIGLAIGGVFIAPLGAKISHHASGAKLKFCFGIFLLAVAGKMLW